MHMCNKLCMFAFIRRKCLAILKAYRPFIIKLLVVVEIAFFTEITNYYCFKCFFPVQRSTKIISKFVFY